ncbi:MAG: hypothetical protein C0483_17835 [Pirellula sp.]|nr:hypothetical protein [Pirellula sp.]
MLSRPQDGWRQVVTMANLVNPNILRRTKINVAAATNSYYLFASTFAGTRVAKERVQRGNIFVGRFGNSLNSSISNTMIRTSRNTTYSEWVATELEWRRIAIQLQELDATMQQRSLSDYVRRGDSFLPLGVLEMSVASASRLTLDELRRFPGVGLVKIRNLCGLLRRIVQVDARFEHEPYALATAGDSDTVSEVTWSQWCNELRGSSELRDPVGRYVEKLDELPRGSWVIPVGDFAALSLHELLRLPGYGAQRAGAVIATIRMLANLRSALNRQTGATVMCTRVEIARADAWFVAALCAPESMNFADLRREVLEPLGRQIRADLGEAYADRDCDGTLSASRVRQVRQEVFAAIQVRWPRGERLVEAFLSTINASWKPDEQASAVRELTRFFPSARRATPETGEKR